MPHLTSVITSIHLVKLKVLLIPNSVTIYIVLAGDFYVDFDCGGSFADILLDFISDLDLDASDLSYRNSVGVTYERDDGLPG